MKSQISNLKSKIKLSGRHGTTGIALFSLLLSACREQPQKSTVDPKGYVITPTKLDPPIENQASEQQLQFVDVAQSAGINFVHTNGAFGYKWMPETLGSGAAFFDYDGDGRPDLLLVNSSYWPGHQVPSPTISQGEREKASSSQALPKEHKGEEPSAPPASAVIKSGERGLQPTSGLFRNKGDGTFEDVTVGSGLDQFVQYGMGAAAADYDGDGDRDVFLTAVGRNLLLANEGGMFVDVTDAAGVGGVPASGSTGWEWSLGATWVDLDHDGDLDLFVCRYVQWTPETDIWTTRDGTNKAYATPERYKGESNILYRNNGDGTFSDITQAAGVFNPSGKSMSVVADDVNNDGWADLVVSNDTQPNFLYINQKDGKFVDAALSSGVAYDENGLARAGMGIDTADYANSGKRAIAIGNFSGEPVSLYTQAAPGSFVDQAGRVQLSGPTEVALTFGVRFDDLDLDGFVDLVLANGHIEPEIEAVRKDWRFAQRPQLFLNKGGERFIDWTDQAGPGFATAVVGRGLATADIDGDGDLDMVITTNAGRPLLLRNEIGAGTEQGAARHAIRIKLRDGGMNRDGIGARLVLKTTDGREQTRFIRGGGSYLSQSELTATFGLGDRPSCAAVVVYWPTGEMETVGPLDANKLYTMERGKGIVDGLAFVTQRP